MTILRDYDDRVPVGADGAGGGTGRPGGSQRLRDPMAPLRHLLSASLDSLRDLVPIVLVVAFFQLVILRQPVPNLAGILVGSLLVVAGLTLFMQGLTLGLFPLGETLAYAFARKGSEVGREPVRPESVKAALPGQVDEVHRRSPT